MPKYVLVIDNEKGIGPFPDFKTAALHRETLVDSDWYMAIPLRTPKKKQQKSTR